MTTPIDTARELLEKVGRNFTTDLAYHLRYGVVYSTPSFFVMARPIIWADGPKGIHALDRPPSADSDTWFIWAAAGRGAIRKALTIAPFPLPFVGWCRSKTGRIRRYGWERVAKFNLTED